jgi:hypothetical protein
MLRRGLRLPQDFNEVLSDLLKVKPPEKAKPKPHRKTKDRKRGRKGH